MGTFLAGGAAIALAKEPEEIWRELSKLAPEEREKRLIAGAKTEGKVVLYGNLSADHLEKVKVDFEKRNPVKLDGYRASGERIANRVLTEYRAGKFEADVIGPSNEHVPALIKAGVLGRYISPERAAYFDTHKDRQGSWTAYDYNVAVIAYNTRLVAAGDVPRKYEDFLEPKWKGNFAIDMDPDKSLMSWLKIWGMEKTKKYLQAITKNDVVVRKGHTLGLPSRTFLSGPDTRYAEPAKRNQKGAPSVLRRFAGRLSAFGNRAKNLSRCRKDIG